MSFAEWRALLEAYLDGRLSAEAFVRRFQQAWNDGRGAPHAIADLNFAVEAFESEMMDAGEEGAVNDDDLRQATERALSNLREGAQVSSSTFDRERTREDMRRFSVQMSGCAGLGCIIAAIWLGLCVLQIYFVSEWIQVTLGWGAWPSAVIGFFLAFVPVIGNLLAFLGATQEGWPVWIAAILFFAAPAMALVFGWPRWRRMRR